jgi:hypothetical protein
MRVRDAIHFGIGQEVVHGFHAVTNHRPPIYGLLGAHPGWSVHEADADGHVAAPVPAPAMAPHAQ